MMHQSELVHPTLYGLDPSGNLRLFGQTCARCEHNCFPRQDFGCENCGATGDALSPADWPPAGTLVSYATVHRHRGTDIAVPFTIGQVKLDAGPFLRCTLDPTDGGPLLIGARVTGVLAPGSGVNIDKQELKFRVESA